MNARLKTAAFAGILSLLLIPPEIFLEETLRTNPGTQWILPVVETAESRLRPAQEGHMHTGPMDSATFPGPDGSSVWPG